MITVKVLWKTSHAKEVNSNKLPDTELWTFLPFVYLHVKKRKGYG
jgi:hypothetical protein